MSSPFYFVQRRKKHGCKYRQERLKTRTQDSPSDHIFSSLRKWPWHLMGILLPMPSIWLTQFCLKVRREEMKKTAPVMVPSLLTVIISLMLESDPKNSIHGYVLYA